MSNGTDDRKENKKTNQPLRAVDTGIDSDRHMLMYHRHHILLTNVTCAVRRPCGSNSFSTIAISDIHFSSGKHVNPRILAGYNLNKDCTWQTKLHAGQECEM